MVIRIVAALLCMGIFGAYAEEDPKRWIQVSGEGEVLVVPDEAIIRCGITLRGKTLEKVKEDCDEKSAALSKALQALGIAEDGITKSAYSYSPYRGKGRDTYSGYQVNRNFSIKTDDVDKLGLLLNAVAEAGINQIDDVELKSSKREQHEDEALKLAARRARQKGQVLAESLDAKLGRALRIHEESSYAYGGGFGGGDPFAAGGGADPFAAPAGAQAGPTYAAGMIKIEATVNVSFELTDR